MKHFLENTKEINLNKFFSLLANDSVVIYSPTSLSQVDHSLWKGLFVSTHDIGKDVEKIEQFCKERKISMVVGFGGGTAIDIAKYIAFTTHARFVCVPTMLSTNAFATNKVALNRNGTKVTIDAILADEILLDQKLVEKAGVFNLYGLCDIFSIHTALYDWRLAAQAGVETIDDDVYARSDSLLKHAVRYVLDTPDLNQPDIITLFTMIGESGHITNLYGTGRPESGSEHIFAKELEQRVKIPHGISVAAGISIMSLLQGRSSKNIQKALERIGVVNDLLERELYEEITACLENLCPRKDRYTILNQKVLSFVDCERITNSFYADIRNVSSEYSYR